MKPTNDFKTVIKSYLEKRAETDTLFAASYAKKNKNIDECCNYIIGEAKKRGNAVAMTDDEVYGLAVHYYDEDNIKINKVSGGSRVSTSVSASKLALTEEEKEAARAEALKAYQAAEQKKLAEREKARKEALKKRAEKQHEVQPSLFEF